MTATPVTVPSNIAPTSPLAQVVRLTQAGVDQSIIMVYVTNSSRTFNLDSDKIIYLSDLGLPADLVTAMMQRDQQLQQEFAFAQAEQQAQQAQQTQQAQTAPAPEAAPANTAEALTPPAPVTVNYFNDTLSPYGSWVVVNDYGRCWRPTAVAYDPNWQPYCDRGHWVYTDCGWYWNSDYAWGATFHYGRWFRDASVGWCWYPDTVWAPSWVTWRYSNNYCGWAPLPPRTYCQTGVGIVYQGGGVSVGFSFGLGASCFTFVPTQDFCNSHPRNYCASPSQVTQIYNNTTVINNIRIHGSGNNQIIINNGIPVQNVAATTPTPIRPVPVHQIDRAFAHGGSGQSADRSGHGFGGNRGNFTGNDNPTALPPVPMHSEPNATATGQNPPRSTAMTGNGNSRPAQNRFTQPVNNQTPQAGQGQFNQAQIRTQPERNNPTALPSVPAHSEPNATATGQNPPRATVITGNGNSRPAQNRFTQPVNNQTPQAGQEQFNQAPVRTQPARNNPVATTPQRPASAENYHSPAYTAPVQTPSANFNPNPQPAPARWQQPETPRNYTRNSEARQNTAAQNQVAPPVNYSAPPQQAQPSHNEPRNYSQPRNEVRQNYSPPPVVAAPQPSAPNVAAAPSPQQQQQGGGRMGNQNWVPR